MCEVLKNLETSLETLYDLRICVLFALDLQITV